MSRTIRVPDMELTESSSASDMEDDVARLVYKIAEEDMADAHSEDGHHLRATRAATLYAALFDTKYARHLLGMGPESVYSASIVFPQIARSSGYQLTYVAISLKMIFLTIACFIIQFYLVIALWMASVYAPSQNGAPHMCTYGQSAGSVAPKGPLGITIAADRSNLEANYNRVILRNSLWEVLQHMNVTNSAIGPVDFGAESPTCRAAAVAAFFVTIILEINSMWSTAWFLIRSPTLHSRNEFHAEQWIGFAEQVPPTGRLRSLVGKDDLHCITFKMAGMPLCWKVLWAWPVLLCQLCIAVLTAYVGFHFLMNTGGIVDLLLNCVALFFILELDNLSFATFATHAARDILQRLEPFQIPVPADEVEAHVRKNTERERHHSIFDRVRRTLGISKMLLCLILVQWGAFMLYFREHCIMDRAPFTSFFLQESYFDSEGMEVFWESIVGRWRSKNTTKRRWLHFQSNETICAPSGNGEQVVGCGLPTPWHGR